MTKTKETNRAETGPEEKKQAKRLNRAEAANRAVVEVNAKTTLAALTEKADGLVVESGGSSNLSEARLCVKRSLECAETLGVVRLTRPVDMLVERV